MDIRRQFEKHEITSYSNLLKWLKSLSLFSASPSQWIATINASKGIRKEEIKRSELLKTLSLYTDDKKLTKKYLLEIAEENLNLCKITLQTERTTSYRPALQTKSFPRELIPQKLIDTFENNEIIGCYKLSSYSYRLIGLRFTGMFGSGESWFVFDEHWRQFRPKKSYQSPLEAVDFLYTEAVAKFSQYSSHSSRNYYEKYALLTKNDSYKEWLVNLPNWLGTFENQHFDLENTVLHLRTSEWHDSRNMPLLLIDEIQSDWHASGRINGYYELGSLTDEKMSNTVADAPFNNEWHELGIKIAIWIALKSGHTRVAFTHGGVHSERYQNNFQGFHLLYDQTIPKVLSKLASKYKCSFGSATITVSKPNENIRYKNGIGWELSTDSENIKPKIIQNEVVAMRYLKSTGKKIDEDVRVFEISPELEVLVKNKGLPLFGWW